MGTKLVVLVQNELNLDFNEVFADARSLGVEISHNVICHTQDPQKVIRAAKGFDYVVAGRETWNAQVLEACSDTLKGIARFGAGLDMVDMDVATRLGIAVSNAPGCNSAAVAEHTLALTLSLLRQVTFLDRGIRSGGVYAKMTQSLEGTVALIGFGCIGQHFAKLLQVFPVKVIAYDPYPNHEIAKELGVEFVSLDEAITRADFLSLHLPSIPSMKDFICKDTIAKMKDGAYFINTSRGSLVNEPDLIDALKSGKIAGAALDVYKAEPFDQSSELKQLENVVLTPHSAAVSTQAVTAVFEHCARVITGYLTGNYDASLSNPDFAKNSAVRIGKK